MKICMLISTPFPPEEGIGFHTYNLSKKLMEKGHEIVVITRGSINKTKKEFFDGIEIYKVPFIPFYPFYIKIHGYFVNKIFKKIEKEIDIVHIHSPLPPYLKTKKPKITTIHTPMLIDHCTYTKLKSLHSFFSKLSARLISYPLEKKLIKNSNIVTTVSETVAKELYAYNINPKNVIISGNGVDEKFFYHKQKQKKDNYKYIMFAGRLDREKGLFDLVDCAEYVCNKRSDVFFIVVGKGRDLNKIRKKTKKKGVDHRFIFLGQVEKNQIVKLYQNASIFVLPSYHEGLPGVLLEAMSCGLPIIATDVRGNRDLITDGKNGVMVPPREPKKLAKAILMLLKNEQIGIKQGLYARKTIEEKYTWNSVSNKFLSCYKSLVEVIT